MSNFDQKNQKVNTQLNADKINIELKSITCPNCQQGNPPKAKFCSECGTSLLFKCPICNSETPLSGKFCSGCGKEINNIFVDIEEARSRRGGLERELVYKFLLKIAINPLNPVDLLKAATTWGTAKMTLDIDEYVIKKEEGVFLYKDESYKRDAEGNLYLTNKRLIFLGRDPDSAWGSTRYESPYPFNEISDARIQSEKLLFMRSSYLRIIWNGKVRRFSSLSDTEIKSWIDTINLCLQGKTPVSKLPENLTDSNLLKCPKCGLPFKTEKSLMEHIKNWHT